jgi:hypothetical protein
MKKERAEELLIRMIKKYVSMVEVGKNKLSNEQVCSDLNIGKKDLKDLGLDFDNRR